ncbi:MAG: glycosyltransferase [Thermoplasmata archaeon]|nr:glycosyltransferase [Thermoplasmata archaeon]
MDNGSVLEGVSVIIATRDRPSMLSDLLDSIRSARPAPEEVVIVDDGSRHPLGNAIGKGGWPFRLKIIRNNVSKGPAIARNTAVHNSRGDILLFTDDDCIVDPEWAYCLAGRLANGSDGLGGVGGRVLAKDGDIFSRYYEFNRILDPRPHDRDHPDRIPYLVTANCGITKDVYMKAGGFDCDMRIAGGEDVAISMRIAKLGRFFQRDEQATVWHRFRPGLRRFCRAFYNYGRGGSHVVDRYLPL